jgi:transcriptional regulator with XRE-family HTH domain
MAMALKMTKEAAAIIAELKAFLESNGIKHRKAAADMGVSPQQLSNWISGQRLPSLANYFRIRRYLDSKR